MDIGTFLSQSSLEWLSNAACFSHLCLAEWWLRDLSLVNWKLGIAGPKVSKSLQKAPGCRCVPYSLGQPHLATRPKTLRPRATGPFVWPIRVNGDIDVQNDVNICEFKNQLSKNIKYYISIITNSFHGVANLPLITVRWLCMKSFIAYDFSNFRCYFRMDHLWSSETKFWTYLFLAPMNIQYSNCSRNFQ